MTQRIVPFDDVVSVAHIPEPGAWPPVYATRVDWVPSYQRGWVPRRHSHQPQPATVCGLSMSDRPWIEWPDDDPAPTCPACLGVREEQTALL